MFFFVRSVLYYTNKYLKTLRLRMETTRAVGEGTAAGGERGSRYNVSRVPLSRTNLSTIYVEENKDRAPVTHQERRTSKRRRCRRTHPLVVNVDELANFIII